jgi:hypothetical protein
LANFESAASLIGLAQWQIGRREKKKGTGSRPISSRRISTSTIVHTLMKAHNNFVRPLFFDLPFFLGHHHESLTFYTNGSVSEYESVLPLPISPLEVATDIRSLAYLKPLRFPCSTFAVDSDLTVASLH